MKLKKLSAVVLAAVMCLGLAACGGKDDAQKPGDTMSPAEIAETITKDVKDLPTSEIMELDAESFASFAFIDMGEGMEGVAAEGLISSVAHSVVVVRVPEGGDAEAVRDSIEQNADPRKWICVEAEKTIVKAHGNTVLLVMSFTDTADAIAANFDGLWK